LLLVSWSQADRDELSQGGPIVVEHSQRAITGRRHGTRLIDHVVEERRQLEIPLDEQDCFEDPAQLGGILD